jgi:hypothetical protein
MQHPCYKDEAQKGQKLSRPHLIMQHPCYKDEAQKGQKLSRPMPPITYVLSILSAANILVIFISLTI